jgi:hypothetical protein
MPNRHLQRATESSLRARLRRTLRDEGIAPTRIVKDLAVTVAD